MTSINNTLKSCKSSSTSASPISVRIVNREEFSEFDDLLAEHHYLGAGQPVGDYLRQAIYLRGELVALLVWGPACYALKDRDLWIGWSAQQRVERLKLVVQNRRFLILSPKGSNPNLASRGMGAALRALPEQWSKRFGYAPLLAESFTDPEAYAGTCYKASNWEAVGRTAGFSRHRADFYIPNERPKKLWMRSLDGQARKTLRLAVLPGRFQKALSLAPSGTLPLGGPHMGSLHDALRHAPDPRASNTRFRIGAVLTIAAMALMAGRRDLAQIHRFGSRLSQAQRARLILPIKRGTKAFRQVPGYSVYREVLSRLDSEAFAAILSTWLSKHAGSLPEALAFDGKMIRDQVGLLTLASHEDGSPQAAVVYDQKKGTKRCEIKAAQTLLKSAPGLDGKTLTADPLHCQRKTARLIVEKGGDYLLQIKDNQPNLFKQAKAIGAADPPFFSARPSRGGA
jgi:hypothetical protein